MIYTFEDNPPALEVIKSSQKFNEQERVTFVTGEAGSGKTELLKKICHDYEEKSINYMVMAPTGVAALNCEGVTLHSGLKLPIGMDKSAPLNLKPLYSPRDDKKINVLRNIEVLIIDEISMVSAFMLDLISKRLCQVNKKSYKVPFGGIKVILIGDLLQLPPVIGYKDHNTYYKYYSSPWFFGASCMKEVTNMKTIMLMKNYRQENDPDYQKLLGSIRSQTSLDTIVKGINKHCISEEALDKSEETILCSTNALCSKYNNTKLAAIDGRTITINGTISRKFPDSMLPVDKDIDIKVGCKVMVCRNIYDETLVASNGDICIVEEYNELEQILILKKVRDNEVFSCPTVLWENIDYINDEESKSIKKLVIGSFEQFPIKLGYACTVHKSQGITLDEAYIDIEKAFVPGLFYVALTRCRSFKGIKLKNYVKKEDLKMDEGILEIYSQIEERTKLFE